MKSSLLLLLLLLAVLTSAAWAEEVIYAQVGDTVTLKPPEGIDSQNTYLYWMFGKEDGVPLAWRNTFDRKWITEDDPWKNLSSPSDNSLVIKNVQQENFGTFFLKQKSSEISFTTYKLLKVTVNVHPPSPLLPGDSLSLSCDAEPLQGHKKPAIHWLNPRGEKKTNNQRVTLMVTSQDDGQWTCVVRNGEKENKAKVSVTVMDLSPAPLLPQYTSASVPLTVPCSLPARISWEQIKAKDLKEIHWHFIPKPGSRLQRLFSLSLEDPLTWKAEQDRGLRPVSDPKKRDLSLTRNRGREDDTGEYVCALEFKNGVTVNRTVHVQVLRVVSSHGTELVSGQKLNLTCSLGHPLPSDLRLEWFPPKPSSQSSPTFDRHTGHIVIPEVGTGDGGKWRCELWQSDTRLTSAEITLKIEPRMSVWMLVVICSITVIVILLLILVFILLRRRQQKIGHLRRQLCQCKTPKPKGFYRT